VPLGSLDVRFRNDRWREEGAPEWTTEAVDAELASLFAYARQWAADADRADDCNLTFSAMLAAMVEHDQPLCRWLRRYFDARGVRSEQITKGHVYPDGKVYPTRPDGAEYLATTLSFRKAFNKASELRDLASSRQPVGVRHFMAAYAVCPDYHLRDFRVYRIDRREWCLRLSDELMDKFANEKAAWGDYRSMAPPLLPLAFDDDTPDGRDQLHLEREVTAFARLIAARSTSTPLSIGVFGAWGSGKSFFMRRTREQVALRAKAAEAKGRDAEDHTRIAQVEFNAWHYSENDVVSSMVDHIFRNLRIDPQDEDDETLRRRGEELMSVLAASQGRLTSTATGVTAAEERLREAERKLAEAHASLPAAVAAANGVLGAAEHDQREAERRLAQAQQTRDAAARNARAGAEAAALLTEISDDPSSTALAGAAGALVGLADDARSARLRWRPIAIGAALLILTIAFAALAGSRAWARAVSVATAVGAFATMARTWIAKLGQIADRGQRFLEERQRAIDEARQRVASRFDQEISGLELEVEARRRATTTAREQLEETAQSAGATALLHSRERELAASRAAHEAARRQVDEARSAVAGNTIDSLLREFLDERHESTDYRARLGVFSQVRNDFERLSKLITRSTNAYYKGAESPPAVSRIVLYVDDLDRCPRDKVVDVLRAVHLLLAFPLFVCVVAVDPRWLATCLETASGVAYTDTKGTARGVDAQFGREGDAADYIEKIFQVPLWLRPVPADRRPALVRSWLDDPDVSLHIERPPLTGAELDFLDQLQSMLDGKPRTLKRLANTYRLVKTALTDVELRDFIGEDRTSAWPNAAGAPYRICMTQLAVLNSDRTRAIAMIDSLDAERSAETIGGWLERFATEEPEMAEFLRTALGDGVDLAIFREWLERTRRYSFYL